MSKLEVKNIVTNSLKDNELLAIKAKYNFDAIFFYAINHTEDFFFGVEEFDFELDGYQIRKYDDISDAIIINNFSSKINKYEGLLEKIIPFDINLKSFETIFNSLKELDCYISIEREYNDEDSFFVIGEIINVTSDSVWFKDFNVDGIWNEEINYIPYEMITTIRFNSKYINTWTKYIKKDRKIGN